jgi:ABC-type iron transport system FetAB ATPase subunit
MFKMNASELQRKTDQIDGFYQALKKQEQDFINELATIKGEIDILTKTSTVLKHLLDNMVKDEISKMAGLVTYGLKTIFDDQNLTFAPKIVKKNEKIHIELKTRDGAPGFFIEGEFESFGGSVAVIESFLMRILCLIKKKLARLMLLDETFAAVGQDYIPNTSRLISQLSKKLGVDILLVTHQNEFQNNADNVYRVKESSNGLLMEKIK